MTTIPMEKLEFFQSAKPGDDILEILRSVYVLPPFYSREWKELKEHIANLTNFHSKRILQAGSKTYLLKQTGGGLLGRGNIDVDIYPYEIRRKARYYLVRHWKVLEVVD